LLIHAKVNAQKLFAKSITFEYTVTCVTVTVDGVWIGKSDLLDSDRSLNTNNYNAIADSLTMQFNTACAKSESAVSSPVVTW
jgi:hypothetical protein